jgi:glutamate N-acetyltransferase/amino-acid N-acetyltransferase
MNMPYKEIPKGSLTSPVGFVASAAKVAIKSDGRFDVGVLYSPSLCSAAGVFTTNNAQAAPVLISRLVAQNGKARAIVVNSGCANACTGAQGLRDAQIMAQKAGELLGCRKEEVFVASTGVIGVPLPMDRVNQGIRQSADSLSGTGGSKVAEAMITTDTAVKEVAVEVELAKDQKVVIAGAAKGSGMIHPNMATMLGFITTDAAISPECLHAMLKKANAYSFNMISVDGDTSTNDMVVVLASGKAGNRIIENDLSPFYMPFFEAFQFVCMTLAKKIAQDGEGATKFLEVAVEGAKTGRDACLSARSVVSSNLVKTAVFGEDANWGRIMCALGNSGADFDPNLVEIRIGHVKVAEKGVGIFFSEALAKRVLENKNVKLSIHLHQGTEEATAWGCDLSHGYIQINSAYRS